MCEMIDQISLSLQLFLRVFLCLDINECDSNPCMQNGTCVDQLASFLCTCPAGIIGALCDEGKTSLTANELARGCKHVFNSNYYTVDPVTPALVYVESCPEVVHFKDIGLILFRMFSNRQTKTGIVLVQAVPHYYSLHIMWYIISIISRIFYLLL